MTAVLAGWVGRIVVLLVAAAVVELALPSGTLRRYVEVVVGLVVLVTVLQPVLGWLGADLRAAAATAEARLERDLAALARSAQGAGPGGGRAAGGGVDQGAAAGQAWFHQEVRRAFAARVAASVRQGLAQTLGVEAEVTVHLAEGPFSPGDVGSDPPPLERVVVQLSGAGGSQPEAGRPVVVQVPVVRVDGQGGGAGPSPAVPRVPDGTAARVRSWVADALGIDAGRVMVVAGEEVER